jgi:hypothetical protein
MMSTGSDKPSDREVAIRNARLRLIQLEIESHRVKAELARLEASRQDEAADRLVQGMPTVDLDDSLPVSWKRVLPGSDIGLTDELLAWAGDVVTKNRATTESPALVAPSSPEQKNKPNQRAKTAAAQPQPAKQRTGSRKSVHQHRSKSGTSPRGAVPKHLPNSSEEPVGYQGCCVQHLHGCSA